MSDIDDALAMLRGHQMIFDAYEQTLEPRSGLYDPDASDDTFDPDDFDDGIDNDHPVPDADEFDPDNFATDYNPDEHECELGDQCPYRSPNGDYIDPEDLVV